MQYSSPTTALDTPRILCVIPTHPKDTEYLKLTLQTVNDQTVPVTTIITPTEISNIANIPRRMSVILNHALNKIDLSLYDYILRIDTDTILPPDFIEKNLEQNADVVGYGHAHLIKVSTFREVMNCTFHRESDDSYLNYKFMYAHKKWMYWNVKPIRSRKCGRTHSKQYFIDRGALMWMLGYEPLHVIGNVRWDFYNVFAVFGYFYAMLNRVTRLDVAKSVFHYQICRLTVDIRRRRRF